MINLVAVIGKAGSGKNTILSKFINENENHYTFKILNKKSSIIYFQIFLVPKEKK